MKKHAIFSGIVAIALVLVGVGCQSVKTGQPAPQVNPEGSLVLVKDGKSLAPIVVFEGAPPFTRRAADELAEYMEKVSGAKPEVIEGTPDPLPKHAIWVGYQPVLKKLFPNVDFDFKNPEEILIVANDDHLVIAGRDKWDPDHLKVKMGRKVIDGIQREYGTANAVYTFIQDCLGVRWLWPGELGEDVVKRKTIAFDPFTFRYHPQFRARSGVFDIYDLYRQHKGHEWTRLQRVQLDSFELPGGHGFTWWWKKYHEDHPEYFALQPDGNRKNWLPPHSGYREGIYVKTCKNNRSVQERWLADVADQLEEHPNQRVFCAAANDGGYEGYCVCDNCRAWDNPDGQPMRHTWQGMSQEYVAVSDRQVQFANTLGRLLKERYPDKDYYVSILAYGNSRPAPVDVVPDDNVIVGGVFSLHCRPPYDNRLKLNHQRMFDDWAKVTRNYTWRPNIIGTNGWKRGDPMSAPRQTIKDLRMAADRGVMGLFFDSVYGHWANQGPHYYMLAQMAWNPYADGEAILADYYQRAYGPATDAMTDYWELVEAAMMEKFFDKKSDVEVWDDDFIKEADALLDQAEREAESGPPVYAKRVGFARAGLDYFQLLKENEKLVKRMLDSGGKDTKSEASLRANWEKIKKLHEEYPPLVNWTYSGPGGSRTRNLQPDWALKEIQRRAGGKK